MGASNARELLYHQGHDLVIVTYGDPEDPVNVSLECETCCCVIIDFDTDEAVNRIRREN